LGIYTNAATNQMQVSCQSKGVSLCALFLPSTMYAVLPRLHIREQSETDPLDVNTYQSFSDCPKTFSLHVMGSILVCPTSRRPSFLIPDLVKGNTSNTIVYLHIGTVV